MLTVRSPASCGNLGAGFDALSMAIDLCNEVTAEPASQLSVENVGEGAETLPAGSDHLVYRAIQRVHQACEREAPPLRLRCQNQIPISRGLGSSASAVSAGLLLGNRLQGDPLSRDDLLALASAMEGHPDNVVSCMLGGIQVSVETDGHVLHSTVPIKIPLRAILFMPDLAIDTQTARRLLPRQVRLEDAVFNLGRAALFVAAAANGHAELLKVATEDRLHQTPRCALFPSMPAMFQAALEAGAMAACLSGAGPTILALATDNVAQITAALENCAARNRVSGSVRIASMRAQGAEIIES